eukprot:CAMPEP_0172569548 /NCGR_PEP_ID=MMETSP1067-20121228/123959_1 /TAXON_ID=265564 ORGANISM="Thalassiosira punctigera, Strain Tpunct2005C2" /NCGR_SAMPLE_ID=MMETSP1067 /ASSEMBLY_ACC=CAM_ASM_000444 /LENGTH=50 /DNA_ID=CAMNT_0013361405 /DNA_START=231 /DNA_END=379 /DNA_ORIENTATION=+
MVVTALAINSLQSAQLLVELGIPRGSHEVHPPDLTREYLLLPSISPVAAP